MFQVYILKSKKNSRYYIGCSKNLKIRLESHNEGKVKSTKAYRPWETVYTERYKIKSQAYKRELQIKSYKSGEAFKKLVNKL